MTDAFFAFEWPVAPDYYWEEWLDSKDRPVRPSARELHPNTSKVFQIEEGKETGPVLMAREGTHTFFRPMERENAALFRVFADLDPFNLDEIKSFVGKHGWLGGARQFQLHKKRDGSFHRAEGEPHTLWISEIKKIREAIWLWEHPRVRAGELGKWLWLFDTHLQHVQGRMIAAGDKPPQLKIAPMHLLSAIWLQFALAVAGDKHYVGCKTCDRQIEISTAQSGYRTNREFCSNSCKTQDYRKRKREALRLARRGEGLVAIAKSIDTERKTVRGWLNAFKDKQRTRGRK